jgi:hypothetical protein
MFGALALVCLAFVWAVRRWDDEDRPTPPWLPRVSTFAMLCVGVTLLLLHLLPLSGYERAFPIDDSYISLTAARNVAQRNLLAVNLEHPLCGVTSPLNSVVVGALGKLISVETAARLVGMAAYLATAYGALIWAMQLGARRSAAMATALLSMLWGPLTFGALNGMETTTFAALLIWSFVAFEAAAARPNMVYAMGALVGAAILTRPEGWFLASALFGAELIRCRRDWRGLARAVAAGGLALAVVAPYLIANFGLTGELLPPTVHAKQYFFNEWCYPVPLKLSIYLLAFTLLGPTLLMCLPLALFSGPWLRRGYPLAFMAIFYVAYFERFPSGLTQYWGRYQHPLLPVLFAGVLLGAQGVFLRARERHRRMAAGFAAVVGLLLFGGGALFAKVEHAAYRYALTTARGYLTSVAAWVRDHSQPGETVGTMDIGALYYFGERPVLDLVGLADPEVSAIHRKHQDEDCDRSRRFDDMYELVKQRRPRIIYLVPKNDALFMGLLKSDGGRHMREAWVSRRELRLENGKEFDAPGYTFYLCDWDRDLRSAKDQGAEHDG